MWENSCTDISAVHYNPFTQNIEVLDSKEKVVSYAEGLKTELTNLIEAIRHIWKINNKYNITLNF